MGFLKDLDDALGGITAPLGAAGRMMRGAVNELADEFIQKTCKECNFRYSNKMEKCPKCVEKKEAGE